MAFTVTRSQPNCQVMSILLIQPKITTFSSTFHTSGKEKPHKSTQEKWGNLRINSGITSLLGL